MVAQHAHVRQQVDHDVRVDRGRTTATVHHVLGKVEEVGQVIQVVEAGGRGQHFGNFDQQRFRQF